MNSKTLLRTAALIITLFMLMFSAACADFEALINGDTGTVHAPEIPHDGSALEIYFIDVGQGDSALLISPTGQTMLIDAGERASFTKISILLESLNIDSLDAVVATHPHSDHIGGMTDVIENYDITHFYLPEFDYDTKTYNNMINALDEKGIEPTYLYGGEDVYLDWDEYVLIECLSPIKDIEYDDANDVSIMLRFTYGDTTALFTGDCERYAEASALYMLPYKDFSADVLKVGHHGSSTSGHDKFLEAVDPDYAVISCGYNNSYGHPHHETLTALENINAQILRTDEMGTIHISLDGERVLVLDN